MLLPLLCFGPMVLAPFVWLAGRKSDRVRDLLAAVICALALGGCLTLLPGETRFSLDGFCGLGLHLRADGFRSLYASVAAFMWLVSDVFAPEYMHHDGMRNRYWLFNLWTLGATLGVFLSDDLYTTLIFFEIMSLTSYTWVAQEETPGAMRAAETYLMVAVIGGLTTLMGLFMLYRQTGTLSFDGLREALEGGTPSPAVTAAVWLTLFGFAAKAGLFPLHIWLPKAHPVAPAPASALLSGILTKSGVFGMIVLCANIMPGVRSFGNALLVLGAVTMLLGALLALFSVDLKRTLACSSVSQIGFITVGLSVMTLLGEEGSLAAYGTLEHMMNHSLIKLCLFLCAGVVYMNLHRLDLNGVRGFGRGKPLLHACFLSGAVSIACIPPLGSGFNSKSLLHEGILELIAELSAHGLTVWPYRVLELLFIFSGGLTVAYMAKLYICLFIEKNADPALQAKYDAMNGRYMRKPAAAALLAASVPLPFLGLFGSALLSPCAERSMPFFGQGSPGHIHYFSGENLIGAAESIAVGALVYLLVVRPLLMASSANQSASGKRVYVNRWPAWLDLEDKVYRPLLSALTAGSSFVFRFIASIPDSKLIRVWIPAAFTAFFRFLAAAPESRPVLVWIPRLLTVATRFLSEITDYIALLIRRLLDSGRARKEDTPSGGFLPAERKRLITLAGHNVGRSMTFGLVLTAAGLLLMIVYLLIRF